MASNSQPLEKGSSFQWWMISFVAAGAGWAAFISLLIPPFVTESTGNAADAGIVMAIISLAAVLAVQMILNGLSELGIITMTGGH